MASVFDNIKVGAPGEAPQLLAPPTMAPRPALPAPGGGTPAPSPAGNPFTGVPVGPPAAPAAPRQPQQQGEGPYAPFGKFLTHFRDSAVALATALNPEQITQDAQGNVRIPPGWHPEAQSFGDRLTALANDLPVVSQINQLRKGQVAEMFGDIAPTLVAGALTHPVGSGVVKGAAKGTLEAATERGDPFTVKVKGIPISYGKPLPKPVSSALKWGAAGAGTGAAAGELVHSPVAGGIVGGTLGGVTGAAYPLVKGFVKGAIKGGRTALAEMAPPRVPIWEADLGSPSDVVEQQPVTQEPFNPEKIFYMRTPKEPPAPPTPRPAPRWQQELGDPQETVTQQPARAAEPAEPPERVFYMRQPPEEAPPPEPAPPRRAVWEKETGTPEETTPEQPAEGGAEDPFNPQRVFYMRPAKPEPPPAVPPAARRPIWESLGTPRETVGWQPARVEGPAPPPQPAPVRPTPVRPTPVRPAAPEAPIPPEAPAPPEEAAPEAPPEAGPQGEPPGQTLQPGQKAVPESEYPEDWETSPETKESLQGGFHAKYKELNLPEIYTPSGGVVPASPAGVRHTKGAMRGVAEIVAPGTAFGDLSPRQMQQMRDYLDTIAIKPTPVQSTVPETLEQHRRGGVIKRKRSPYLDQLQRRSLNRGAVLRQLTG